MKFIWLAIACTVLRAHAQTEECKDSAVNCEIFVNDCKRKPAFFKKNCKKTCGYCVGPSTPAPPPTKPYTGKPPVCGVPQIQGERVVAGTTAKDGAWPWQILLMLRGRGFCGGSIISPRHILTAAHCVSRYRDSPTLLIVRVGEHNTRTKFWNMKEHIVEKIFVHERYQRPTTLNNDIAILKLKSPIQFNKYVQPVCLPDKDVPVGTECYITGWGATRSRSRGGSMVHILQQAKMPVVSNDVCHKKNFPNIDIPVTDAMICGGDGGKSWKSGCQGDSGGPFVCHLNGHWELHGAVSHGSPHCNSRETYTVFARVAYFRQWIDDILSL